MDAARRTVAESAPKPIRAKLTKTVVESAEPREKDYFIWDTRLPGFCCRIYPSGKRNYWVQYKRGHGQARATRRKKLGLHGHITADEARVLAQQLLGDVAKGGDPAGELAASRKAVTMAAFCKQYLDAADKGLILGKRGKPKKASTLATDRGRIERHIIPLLGKKLVKDLSAADISKFIRDIAAGKTAADIRRKPEAGEQQAGVEYSDTIKKRGRAIVKGGKGTASRTAGLLGGILSYATSEGIRPDNPAHADSVKRFAYKRRKVVLRPEQYRALGEALAQAEREGENKKAVDAIWVIALTACRRDEIAALKQVEVDVQGRCFRFLDTKEDESIRPVGKPAIAVLKRAMKGNNSDYIFPGERGGDHYGGLPDAWKRVRALADGELGSLTLHGLRHAFSSVANELGYTKITRAALLGHSGSLSQTDDYTHHLDSVLLAAADKVARRIYAMMTGESAQVIESQPAVAR